MANPYSVNQAQASVARQDSIMLIRPVDNLRGSISRWRGEGYCGGRTRPHILCYMHLSSLLLAFPLSSNSRVYLFWSHLELQVPTFLYIFYLKKDNRAGYCKEIAIQAVHN
jgi:hypothetical protein